MGEPDTLNSAGTVMATLVTVPEPAANGENVSVVLSSTIGVVDVEYVQYVPAFAVPSRAYTRNP
jgi:hypothetical protein